ncbi:MAG: hypothetical protein FJ306_09395 [Planctomycetes bacterium]|nr:hypothetical protein [Planctomycetota bacterium]
MAALLLVACGVPPSPPPPGAPVAVRLPVRVDFVPPLRMPGALWFACENGTGGSVSAACSGVDLRLPPGPATLTLKADGAVREFVVVVTRGMAPVRWRLEPAPTRRAAAGKSAPTMAGRRTPR